VTKPHEIETCEPFECPIWTTSEWSGCLAACGKGIQTRSVRCVVEKKRTQTKDLVIVEVDKSKCNKLQEPTSSIECSAPKACPEWRVTPWTSCSVSCGKGHRMRYVYCSDKSAGSLECSAKTRPPNSEVCIMPACLNSWKVGDWSEVYIFLYRHLSNDLWIFFYKSKFYFYLNLTESTNFFLKKCFFG
jgi:a disintegrin and metalloproteinase with thrombospondin motifs 9